MLKNVSVTIAPKPVPTSLKPPIRLAGNNPNLYAYTFDSNVEIARLGYRMNLEWQVMVIHYIPKMDCLLMNDFKTHAYLIMVWLMAKCMA